MSKIAVYCSSSNDLLECYEDSAREVGKIIGKNKHELWYGGTRLGLMGVVAKSVQDNGGKVVGVIPEIFRKLAKGEDKVIFVRNLEERMNLIESQADVFIALPGGFGTLEEIFKIMVGKQLGSFNPQNNISNKPFAILNTDGFYNNLLAQLELIYNKNFASPESRSFYFVARTPSEAFEYAERYTPSVVREKILKNRDN